MRSEVSKNRFFPRWGRRLAGGLLNAKKATGKFLQIRQNYPIITALLESHIFLFLYAFFQGYADVTSVPICLPLFVFVLAVAGTPFLHQIVFAVFWGLGVDAINHQPVGQTFVLHVFWLFVYWSFFSTHGEQQSLQLRPLLAATGFVGLMEVFRTGYFQFQLPAFMEFTSVFLTVLILGFLFTLREIISALGGNTIRSEKHSEKSSRGSRAFS